jgi:hypothetical protein
MQQMLLPVATAPDAATTPAAGNGTGSAGTPGIPTPPTKLPDAQVPSVPSDAGVPMTTDAMVVHVEDDDDAGSWVPPDPECVGGEWRLAPGFLLAKKVDYVADRTTFVLDGGMLDDKTTTLSSAGMACASSSDKERCQAGLALPASDQGRHLVTTAGDSVRLWNAGVAGNLLGQIDTKSEAVWWSIMRGSYILPCNVKVELGDGGFTVSGAVSSACGPIPDPSTHRPLNLWVGKTGELLESGLQDPNGFLCGPPSDGGVPTAGTSGAAGFGQL